jgi:hypothetical protein
VFVTSQTSVLKAITAISETRAILDKNSSPILALEGLFASFVINKLVDLQSQKTLNF